ncbi:MAG TPA: glucoamylase family protein [Bryobacteraceae bacterium]|nr:glucoamylase family protein [Bryobacteraceae bacterium]HTW63616.1 glucoamylase family protein [Bryobacteraceae bacterium]
METGEGLTRRALVIGSAAGALARGTDVLDDLARRCFRYFWEQSDPGTGIARDRARADASEYPENGRYVGSTGATGFALTALCIGAKRNWISNGEARERARVTLRSYAEGPVANEHGWFYHFIDVRSGERHGNSEVSTSDSTWLVAGALTARQCFRDDREIRELATKIYERVDYRWMLNGDPYLLSHGWRPETGFIQFRYAKYCQLACMYLLGIGSRTHALSPESWYAWDRDPFEYDGFRYYGRSLLWTYQYPFAWWDFRDRREARGLKVDWFQNSCTATQAHRRFCMDLATEFPGYSADIWGITSSASPKGYTAWGGPPATKNLDGTVVPCAAAGSLMLVPEICLPAVRAIKQRFGDKIYRRYGFVDVFNPNTGWQAQDVIGIDVGITLLSIENLRSGNVWKWFMSSADARRAFDLAGIEKS